MENIKDIKRYKEGTGELESHEIVVKVENNDDLLGEAVYAIYCANKIIVDIKTLAQKRVIDYARIESRLESAIEKLEKQKEKFNSLKLSLKLEQEQEKRDERNAKR